MDEFHDVGAVAYLGAVGSDGTPLSLEATFQCPYCGHIEVGAPFEPNQPMRDHLRLRHSDYGTCDVPWCGKCIRGYKRAVNFPCGRTEEEVFV